MGSGFNFFPDTTPANGEKMPPLSQRPVRDERRMNQYSIFTAAAAGISRSRRAKRRRG
ncbi:Uncharacterized protein ToN1_44660 [Aromatoleum petrolei]|nr:Uncharacterized protein ToN1_44660 [Aromatoleum petrolei]